MIPSVDPCHVYVAGPMRGIPLDNAPRFNAVSTYLRSFGHIVFNPAEEDTTRAQPFSLRAALSADLAFICDYAKMIVMLPGWELSQGAQPEHRTAVALQIEGMRIAYLSEDDCKQIEAMYA